ncbi:MAG: hypothetical protein M3066_11805, partial [Actinomycetota bacterium]|nr:hypothetical protein [Actinomycetota bacterium]
MFPLKLRGGDADKRLVRAYRRLTSPALAGILIVVVLTAGAISAAAEGNRQAASGGQVRTDGGTLAADGTVRAAAERLAAVDAAAAAARASRLPEPTST